MKSGNQNGVQASEYLVASSKSLHERLRRNTTTTTTTNNNNNNISIVDVIGEISKYVSVLRHRMGKPNFNTQTTILFFESMPTLKYLET
jgi:hypothetical protein